MNEKENKLRIDQKFIHLSRFYIDDLMEEVQEKIKEMNSFHWRLVDFKFSGLEKENGNSHAFLLFDGTCK